MIPVLDKGYIKLLASSFPGCKLAEFFKEYNRKPSIALANIVNLTIGIKCPLFVQLYLSDQGVSCIAQRPAQAPEAYLPTMAEIGSPDIMINQQVSDYITQTTEALFVNQDSFKMDQCDSFVTQVLTPISTYNTIVASGSLIDWMRVVTTTGLPRPIEAYRKAINDLMMGEWPNINEVMRVLKT